MTITTQVTFAELEARALAAHLAGTGWARFWPTVRDNVLAMADGDRLRFERLRDRMLSLVVSGSMDGLEPPGDPWGDPSSPHPRAAGSFRRPRPSLTDWSDLRTNKCPYLHVIRHQTTTGEP